MDKISPHKKPPTFFHMTQTPDFLQKTGGFAEHPTATVISVYQSIVVCFTRTDWHGF